MEALAVADPVALEVLADDILAAGAVVSVTTGPESVTTPVRFPLPDSESATTVLGHVALTRCTVDMGGTRGDGIRGGYDMVGAVAAAICDAECERGGPLSARVVALCATAADELADRARARATLVAATRLEQT
jgi:alpha-D-ribose 1-methylphosphonate 5-triphosphate synthase subunit PhnG